MRFRRRSRGVVRRREPTFWVRGCSSATFGQAAAYTSPDCGDSRILAVDELMVGNPDFGSEDKRYTEVGLRIEPTLFVEASSLSGTDMALWLWGIAVKCDIGMLAALLTNAAKLSEILFGQSATVPNAMDVLGIWTWTWNNQEPTFGGFSGHFSGPTSLSIRAKRKLEASECIAMLWGCDMMPSGATLPSATHFTVNQRLIVSRLYKRTMR